MLKEFLVVVVTTFYFSGCLATLALGHGMQKDIFLKFFVGFLVERLKV